MNSHLNNSDYINLFPTMKPEPEFKEVEEQHPDQKSQKS